MRADIKQLLDDFYGDSRTDAHKEETVEFVVNYAVELLDILKASDYE